MSNARELIIKISGDNAGIKQQAQASVEALKKVDKQAAQSNAERMEGLGKVSKEEQKANQAAIKSHQAVGQAGVAAYAQIGLAQAGANLALAKGLELAKAYIDASQKAAQKSRELASTFTSQRDQMRDLATMMGVKANNAFTMANARFNVGAAMNGGEGLAFRSAFQGSGAAYAGKSMSQAEFEQYEKQTAALTAARGLEAGVGGDLSGSFLGLRNYSKFGDQASETATGDVNKSLAILGRGKGDNAVLARQLNMLAAGSVNEDALKGSIQDPAEAAAMISAAAEKSPMQASELSMMALRGLRQFDNDLIKAAKIKPNTSPIDAFKMLEPVVAKMAKDQGVKPEDILRKGFSDVGTAEAINVFLNKGVNGGVFDDRLNYGKQFTKDAALGAIGDFQASEAGQARIADARLEEVRLGRGAENSKVEILRRQALARLIEQKKIDTTSTNMTDFISGRASFGLLGSDERTRIDSEVEDSLVNQQMKLNDPGLFKVNGQPVKRIHQTGNLMSSEDTEAQFRGQIGSIEKAGGNPFTGEKAVGLLDEINKNLKAALPPQAPTVPAALPAGPATTNKRGTP